MSIVKTHHAAKRRHASPRTASRRSLEQSAWNVSELDRSTADPTFTPYKDRNLRLSSLQLPTSTSHASSQNIRKLKCLIDSHWHLFFVSPLHNWNYNEVNLKRYGRRLTEKLVAKSKEENMFEVSYTTIPGLCFSRSDDPAIELQVLKVSEKEHHSLVYRAILFSWNVNGYDKPAGSTFLPFLLCKGNVGISKIVHAGFQEIHDCVVTPKYLEDEDLRCLLVGYFASVPNQKNEPLTLTFYVPKRKKTGQCVLTLPTESLHLLWKCIHGSENRKFQMEDVNLMWENIHHHIKLSFGIDLDHFFLEAAKLRQLSISNKTICARTIEGMNLVLNFLCGQLNILESAAPTLNCIQ